MESSSIRRRPVAAIDRRLYRRGWRPGSRRSRGLKLLILAGLAAGACVPRTPPEPAASRLPAELLPFLPDVSPDCELREAALGEAVALHRGLGAGQAADRIETQARAILTRDPEAVAARAVLAQSLLVQSRTAEVIELTSFPMGDLESCPALAVARGRALDLSGDLPRAFQAYRIAGGALEAAVSRAAAISGPARDAARAEFGAALAKGHVEAAGFFLEQLELWWPRSEAALRSRFELAAATRDVERELAAVRALHEASGSDPGLTLRRAQLEIEAGDPRIGLELVELLATAHPGDPALESELSRARFEWRLLNAPEAVRRQRNLAESSRADFAMLVYWMVPRVRTARPAAGRIASDVLDHPAREEIVRLVNLGLMSVDDSVHRFSPASPLRQVEAHRILLRLIRFLAPETACAAPRESLCEAAAACRLVAPVAECSPAAAVGGREAIEMLRAALVATGEG